MPKLTIAFASSYSISFCAQFQTATIPALGFVQIPQGGQFFVGVSEVEGGNGFSSIIANALHN